MKICYDTLDGVKLTSNGVFMKKNSTSYIEMIACKGCGEPYLTLKHRISNFCSRTCSFKTRKYSDKARKNMSIAKKGKPTKNGSCLLNLPAYDTYASRLWCDNTGYIYIDNLKVLTVKCTKCDKVFIPKISSVVHRVRFLENKESCESRFYCSKECKSICPIFGQHRYPKGFIYKYDYTNNEYKIWREEVLKRANYKCEYCGDKAENIHHIKHKRIEPFFALDPDYGLACCEKCHYKYGHAGECNTSTIYNNMCIEKLNG